MKAVARAFGVSRSNLMAAPTVRQQRIADVEEDTAVLAALKAIASKRSTYGYRRTGAIRNRLRRREGMAPINHKRAYRLMRDAKLLLQRHTGKPTRTHDGKVITLSCRVVQTRIRTDEGSTQLPSSTASSRRSAASSNAAGTLRRRSPASINSNVVPVGNQELIAGATSMNSGESPFARAPAPRRASCPSCLFQCRSVDSFTPSRAANSAPPRPLSTHCATRFSHCARRPRAIREVYRAPR